MARADIHPENRLVKFTCTGCSNTFSIPSTLQSDAFQVEHCNECHPVYTGVRTVARSDAISKFNQRYSRRKSSNSQKDEK